MIIDVIEDKKLMVTIVTTTIALFLFSYIVLGEGLLYSLAVACIPIPLYCLYDKFCVLRNIKKYRHSGSELYIRAGINLVMMDLLLAFCVFQFSKGGVICTSILVCLYTLMDLILLITKLRYDRLKML